MAFLKVTLSLDSANPSALGFGTPLLLSPNADASFVGDRARVYSSASAVKADFPSLTGGEYLWAAGMFAQDPHPDHVVIGRCANKPTMVYEMSAYAVIPGATYKIDVDGDGVTSTELRIVLPPTDVVVTSVTNGSDLLTKAGHGMATGEGPYRMANSGGALPLGLAVDTDYWVIKVDADGFKLASTKANALAGTAVNLTGDGTGTQTVLRTTNDVLMAIIKDRGNAVPGKNYTITQVTGAGETDTLLWTANAAGNWFSAAVDVAQLAIAQVYADPGVAADLDAIQAANSDWYQVHSLFNSKAIVLAIAAWVEANTGSDDDPHPHYYEAETNNSLSMTAAVGGGGNDIGDAIKSLACTRTRVSYYPKPQRMLTARATGRLYPLPPGQVDAVYKQLAGIEPLERSITSYTDTHKANLKAKRMSGYHLEKGVAVTFGGMMASGEWWDVLRSLDAVTDQLAVELLRIRLNNDILPMTDGGIASLESGMRTVVGSNTVIPGIREKAIIADTPAPRYTIPRATEISAANRTARRASPLSCAFRLAGSINGVDVTLNVTQ
jgi:hypothetical protein